MSAGSNRWRCASGRGVGARSNSARGEGGGSRLAASRPLLTAEAGLSSSPGNEAGEKLLGAQSLAASHEAVHAPQWERARQAPTFGQGHLHHQPPCGGKEPYAAAAAAASSLKRGAAVRSQQRERHARSGGTRVGCPRGCALRVFTLGARSAKSTPRSGAEAAVSCCCGALPLMPPTCRILGPGVQQARVAV